MTRLVIISVALILLSLCIMTFGWHESNKMKRDAMVIFYAGIVLYIVGILLAALLVITWLGFSLNY